MSTAMKLQHLVLITGFLATGFCAQAQQRNEDKTYTSNEQQIAEAIGLERLVTVRDLPVNSRNLSVLLQEGDNNRAITTQRNDALLSNQVAITQVGAFNDTEASQVGNNNRTVVRQTGTLNVVRSEVVGSNNQTDIAQDGDRNQVMQQFNADNQTYRIVQDGYDNVLEQRGVSTTAPLGYDIKMEGSGIQISIEQNKLP